MKLTMMLLIGVGVVAAQAPRGEAVYARTCASGYCHGARGEGGGAPRLAARGLELPYLADKITGGVDGSGMPAFGKTLPKADLEGVIAYIASLNSIATSATASNRAAPVALNTQAKQGEALFRDAVKGFGRCTTCHLVGNYGIAVAAPMHTVPATVAALKTLATPRVVTATVSGEAMPALIVAKKTTEVTFYDLTTPPPVFRTVAPNAFTGTESSAWKHSGVIGAYNDTELTAVLAYLRAVIR
jgi:mono/diheme cytochrome c family protein